MDRYDVNKTHKGLYSPAAKEFTVVEVPELRYVAVDGRGDPNTSPEYADAVGPLEDMVRAATDDVARRKAVASLDRVRLRTFIEGTILRQPVKRRRK